MDLAVLAYHRVKNKRKRKDKHIPGPCQRSKKKQWNMKVTVIPIVISALETVSKGLEERLEELEIGGRIETIQSTTLLNLAIIPRRVLVASGD